MLRIVTPPASYPVSVAEAKAQLRIASGDISNDVMVEALIPAATKFCQSLVQRVFVLQTLEWVLPCWRSSLDLPIAPVLADQVVSIKFVDWAGETQVTLDPSAYVLQTIGGPGVRIVPKLGTCWPLLFARSPEPVVVRFDAGYEDPAELPGNVKVAILLMLRHLYTMGEASLTLTSDTVFGVGQQQFAVPANLQTLIPDAVRNLMLDEVW
ncbi:putative phiE125 gp8 family phage protein [Bradyrhizobium sp. LA6.1]|uniref:head-tail connector protein n=1 Tax=Bradyrhizobium sp. LA6.1 TaxID=3156378 RepID=UPI003392E489